MFIIKEVFLKFFLCLLLLGASYVANAAPKRVITLAPSLGELAAEVLGEDLDRIVGVTEFTDYPPALKKVSSIGPYSHFNLEKVMALKPDLVLGTTDGNSKEQIEHLRELKIPVVVVSTENFEKIEESICLVAEALGLPKVGEQMARRLKQGLKNLHAHRPASASKPKVLLQIGVSPTVVVGGGTFLDQAIRTIGARNIFEDSKIHYPRPSREEILARNPDVIVILEMGESAATTAAAVKDWASYSTLKAAKNRKIRVLNSDSLMRPSLRILEGLSLLERIVYGNP